MVRFALGIHLVAGVAVAPILLLMLVLLCEPSSGFHPSGITYNSRVQTKVNGQQHFSRRSLRLQVAMTPPTTTTTTTTTTKATLENNSDDDNNKNNNSNRDNNETAAVTGEQNNPDSSNTPKPPPPPQQLPQRTLYEILGARATDTRVQIKQKYVALAKISHPDAMISASRSSGAGSDSLDSSDGSWPQRPVIATVVHDFSEIAAAWRILSDPVQRRRYDRSLQAADLTENIASFVSRTISDPVTEMTVRALENVALPFLRRTTATTLSAVQAAVRHTNKDLSQTFQTAMKAAKSAGKAVDCMELMEKSELLQEQAVVEYRQALALRHELQVAASERLRLSLHTAHSGLTAAEASILLETFQNNSSITTTANNNKDTAETMMSAAASATTTPHAATITTNPKKSTVWERLNFLRMSVERDIQALTSVERAFLQHQQKDALAQDVYQTAVRERLLARSALSQAEKAETEARRVYEQARAVADEKRLALDQAVTQLSSSEHVAATSSSELERLQLAVQHQSEAVRTALCRKESALLKQQQQQQLQQRGVESTTAAAASSFNSAATTTTASSSLPEVIADSAPNDLVNEIRLQKLATLRQQEREMAATATAMEVQAAKLLSRANKFKHQATELEK